MSVHFSSHSVLSHSLWLHGLQANSQSWLKLIPLRWWCHLTISSSVAHMVKNPPAVWKTWVLSLGQEDPLEEGMATHSSILVWRIPWIEEPGGLQSMGSERVRHEWGSKHIKQRGTWSLSLWQKWCLPKPSQNGALDLNVKCKTRKSHRIKI